MKANPRARPALSTGRSAASSLVAWIFGVGALLLIPAAQAQIVFAVPTSSAATTVNSGPTWNGSSGASNNVAVTGPNSFFSGSVAAANGITGTGFGASVTYTLSSLASGNYVNYILRFSTDNTTPSSFNAPANSGNLTGQSVPISYSFTLGSTGSVSNVNWSITMTVPGAGSNPTIASGTGTGTFSGNVTYTAPSSMTLSGFTLDLATSFNGAASDALTVTMTSGSNQGFKIGGTPVPEPGMTAAALGAAALGFVSWRRRRNSLKSLAAA